MAHYSQQQDPIYQAEATELAGAAPAARDRGLFHHNKPTDTSYTDTGYGGQSTLGTTPMAPDAAAHTKKEGSMADKVKGALHSITGQKKHGEGVTSPTDAAKTHHTTTYDEGVTGTAGHEKVGCMDKVKNLVTGQKPSHGTSGAKHHSPTGAEGGYVGTGNEYGGQTLGDHHVQQDYVQGGVPGYGGEAGYGGGSSYEQSAQGWPQPVHPSAHVTPGATYTDPAGNPVQGPRDDNVKKEGMMSKVMDKLHMGGQKDANKNVPTQY